MHHIYPHSTCRIREIFQVNLIRRSVMFDARQYCEVVATLRGCLSLFVGIISVGGGA